MRLLLDTIVSGYQTGADFGGVLAALDLDLMLTGWMPKGYRTEAGPRPGYSRIGAKEHASSGWLPRTYANIQDTDATLVLAGSLTGGSLRTVQYAEKVGKPVLHQAAPEAEELLAFLVANGVRTLNVAGSRESKSPGIEARTRAYLVRALQPHLP